MKIAGIQITIEKSFWIYILVGFLFNLMTPTGIPFFLFTTSILFGSVLLHELAHALAARYFGYSTKGISLTFFGGIAFIEKLKSNKPWHEILISAAGPMFNLCIIFPIFLYLSHITCGISAEHWFDYIWIINLMLGVFNLVPAYPMDGGRIFRSLFSLFFGHKIATDMAHGLAIILCILFVITAIKYTLPMLIIIVIFILLSIWAERNMRV